MARLMRLLMITGSVAVAVMTTGFFGQGAGRAQDLRPAPRPESKIVVSTVALSRTREPAVNNGVARNEAANTQDVPQKKLDDLSTRIQAIVVVSRATQGLHKVFQ